MKQPGNGMYRGILTRIDQERHLYMAVTKATYDDIFEQPLGRLMVDEFQISLIVFDKAAESIVKWTKWTPTS